MFKVNEEVKVRPLVELEKLHEKYKRSEHHRADYLKYAKESPIGTYMVTSIMDDALNPLLQVVCDCLHVESGETRSFFAYELEKHYSVSFKNIPHY